METINIIFASNNNYAQPLGVAIYSLLDNFYSNKYKLKITVLEGKISEENKTKIRNFGNKFDTEIIFIKISDEIFNGCRDTILYTLVTYYRLLIPDILDKDVKKAIYLDCDILVLGNIVELYKKNIDNYLLGASQDRNTPEEYFNAGILLMNLVKMREEDFTQKIIDFIKKTDRVLLYPDQDALNIFCKNQWLKIESIWNFEINKNELKTTPNPIIIHYISNFKPWHRFYHNYYQKFYRKYLKKWPGYKIKETDFKTAIKQLLKYIPFSIKLAGPLRKLKNKILKR